MTEFSAHLQTVELSIEDETQLQAGECFLFQAMVVDEEAALSSAKFVAEAHYISGISIGRARIHPLLFGYFQDLFSSRTTTMRSVSPMNPSDPNILSLDPLPSSADRYPQLNGDAMNAVKWRKKIVQAIDTEENMVVSMEILQASRIPTVEQVSVSLAGTLLLADAPMVVDILDEEMIMVATVETNNQGDVFRVSTKIQLTLKYDGIDLTKGENCLSLPTENEEHDFEFIESPGYDDLLLNLVEMVSLEWPLAPSGIVLSGVAGVGKSRLVRALECKMVTNDTIPWRTHYISVQDLILEASGATAEDILRMIIPQTREPNRRVVVIIDDMDAVCDPSESSEMDSERNLVRTSILQAIDYLVEAKSMVLGLVRSVSGLPVEVTKSGRLEKEMVVPVPSLEQREQILISLMEDFVDDYGQRTSWARALVPNLTGCVADDLYRMCSQIYNEVRSRGGRQATWEDIYNTAQRIVPSQLEALDIVSAAPIDGPQNVVNWEAHFWKRWKPVAGYGVLKRRVLHRLVLPWQRRRHDLSGTFGIVPASGVLFHGVSGCGKTLAAKCLGESLGMPVIQVRASDVLDKYVGGSEAIVRAIFSRARSAAPCIVWIDEIDAIACNREDEEEGTGVSSRILSTLLNEMDGIIGKEPGRDSNDGIGVLVVACTGRIESLDSALLRPGRLEEHISIDLPDESDVIDILKSALAKVPVGDNGDVLLTEWAKLLVSRKASGADVVGTVREACHRMLRRDHFNPKLTVDDLVDAIDYLL